MQYLTPNYLALILTNTNPMKKIFLLAATFLVAFTATTPVNDIKPLYQLTGGVWKMKTTKGFICESWKKTGANELTGSSYRITGKDTSVTERVQLIKKGNEIFYNPTVTGENNGKPIPFKLTWASKSTYLFTNPEHDYPQVVAYQFVSKDSLNAWIDGNYK
jgi:hypothetical protein